MANNNRGSNTTKPSNKSSSKANVGPVVTPPTMPKPSPTPPTNSNGSRGLTPKQAAMLKRQRDRRRNQVVIGSLIVVVAVVIGLLLYSFANTPENIENVPAATSIQQSGFVLGDPNAKVTLTEWGDFRCSACDRFYTDVESNIVDNYVKTGKIKFEFKNFITIDPTGTIGDSHEAAEAGWCAADQNRFWDFYNTAYQNYPGETPGFWTVKKLEGVAVVQKMDTAKFNSCLESHQHQNDVAQQQTQAQQNGYNGTPTLVINGNQFTGNFDSTDEVRAALDKAIAAANGTSSTSTTPGANATTSSATTTQAATTTASK
jgi:protein-disulfide isomerase